MKFLTALLLLSISISSTAQIDLTQLDGIISEEENARFQKLGENRTSEISAIVDGDYIKINVKSDTMYVASLCLCSDEKKTIVLHASSALGQINYAYDSESWTTEEQFTWKVRERDMSASTLAKRRNYLDEFGWVANTTPMGSNKEVEFIIRKDLFTGNRVLLAAGLMLKSDPENIVPLPAKTSGDCAALSLVAGNRENSYQFEPKNWFRIDL